MSDDNIVDLFTGQPVRPPESEESMWVEEFVEETLPELYGTVQTMVNAATEAEFVRWIAEVKAMVAAWPDGPP